MAGFTTFPEGTNKEERSKGYLAGYDYFFDRAYLDPVKKEENKKMMETAHPDFIKGFHKALEDCWR